MGAGTREAWLCAVTVAFATASAALADGLILTDGATIESGAAPARGVVTIDPAAPLAGPVPQPLDPGTLGAMGSMTGTMPPFPGAGAGGAPFVGAADVTLPGGTYDVTTYTVNAGVTVTYTDAVTIRATGDVQLDGLVRSTATGASITILAGGDVHVRASAGAVVAGVRTEGAGADVTLDASDTLLSSSVNAASRGQIRAVAGAMTLHGRSGGVRALHLEYVDVAAVAAITMRATSALELSRMTCTTTTGPVLLQAFGRNVDLRLTTLTGGSGDITLEGSESAVVAATTTIAGAGDITLRGVAVNAEVSGDSTVRCDSGGDLADVRVHAARDVEITDGGAVRHTGSGAVDVVAFAGSVRLGFDSVVEQAFAGDVRLAAAQDVELGFDNVVHAVSGDVLIRTFAGDVVSFAYAETSVLADDGAVDVRAGRDVVTYFVAGAKPDGAALDIVGSSVTISAQDDFIDFLAEIVRSTSGDVRLIAGDQLAFGGDASAAGDLTMTSVSGIVVLSDVQVTTAAGGGAVTIESYADDAGVIDATGAVIRSGDHPTRSGDVTLRVVVGVPVVIEGYVLPQAVSVKLNAQNPARSLLKTKGFFDTGPDAVDLSGAVTLTVGDVVVAANLAADAKGRFSAKTDQYVLSVVPAKSGSSKAKFKLKFTGDFRGFLDAVGTGDFRIAFENDEVDGDGVVRLEKGRYKLGKKRGALVAPNLFLFRAKAKLAGGAEDGLQLLAGLATAGPTPPAAPDLDLAFGDAYGVDVVGSAFDGPVRERFVARAPVPGAKVVVLDYLRETLAFKASRVELGDMEAGPSAPATVRIGLGNDVRTVRVRLGRRGSKLAY